ncbi:ATP-binding cassette domain-containing protein [bacterium]|nr:ATP-binding cassette domain-containing protein [bacterium]
MVEFKNVTIKYSENVGIFNVNLSIGKGEFVFLLGDSGAGKSTILKAIYFDEIPTSGEVIFAEHSSLTLKNKELPFIRRKIGVVFYDFKLLEDRNVFENVAFALRVTQMPRKQVKIKTLKILTEMGLVQQRYKMPNNLSAGEKQKVAIARALINEPYILLADEPTGNLDIASEREIIEILKKVNLRGTAVLMATHNTRIVEENTSFQKIYLSKGKITG